MLFSVFMLPEMFSPGMQSLLSVLGTLFGVGVQLAVGFLVVLLARSLVFLKLLLTAV